MSYLRDSRMGPCGATCKLLHILLACSALLIIAAPANGQGLTIDPANLDTGTLQNGLKFGGPRLGAGVNGATAKAASAVVNLLPTGEGIASNRSLNGNSYGLDFYTFSAVRMSLTAGGRVGIGTLAPSRALEINSAGDVEIGLKSLDSNRLWTIQSSGSNVDSTLNGTFQIVDRGIGVDAIGKSRLKIDQDGIVSVGVLQITGGSDLAEPFMTSSGGIPKGALVVIDEQAPGQVKMSTRAYDTRVAGVVSGAGGLKPGVRLTSLDGQTSADVTLSGRAYALADATDASIRPGDMLTSSGTPGYCMKVIDARRGRGAVVGKAMTSLASGKGMVLVLITLQ